MTFWGKLYWTHGLHVEAYKGVLGQEDEMESWESSFCELGQHGISGVLRALWHAKWAGRHHVISLTWLWIWFANCVKNTGAGGFDSQCS